MKVTIERISPKTAKEYLNHNMVNRSLNERRAGIYARDMLDGEWQLNGEAIRFNQKGELIDGQHRLRAIVKAGISVDMVVMRDIDNNVSLYDRGRNRSETDSLIIEGMPKELANNTTIAMAKLHQYIINGNSCMSLASIKQFLIDNSEGIILVSAATNGKRGSGNTISTRLNTHNAFMGLAMLYGYASGIDISVINRFLVVVKTGFYDSTKHESAAIVIRNDILSKSLTRDKNEGPETRKFSCFATTQALYDFSSGIDRKMTYRIVKKPAFNINLLSHKGGKKKGLICNIY